MTRRPHDSAEEYLKRIKDALRKEVRQIDLEYEYVDIWSLFDCIAKFKEIISKEKGNEVHINVSTGTKVTAIAGTIVSMLEEDATPYYATVDHTKQPGSESVGEIFPVPVYRIQRPRAEALKILEYVEELGGVARKRDLRKKLEKDKTIKPVGKDELSPAAALGQLRALLDPLEREWGFVMVESRGSSSTVTLTEQGRKGLQVFKIADAR